MLDCGHCGARVLPMADGRCPACWTALDAPVTDADRARVAARRAHDARWRGREPIPAAPIRSPSGAALVGIATVGLGGLALWSGFGVGTLVEALRSPEGLFATERPEVEAAARLVDLGWCAGVGATLAALTRRTRGGTALLALGLYVLLAATPLLACGLLLWAQALGRS